jgi:hypothetical protein
MMADASLVATYSPAISCVCSKRKLWIEWTVYVSRSQVCDQLYTPMLQTSLCRFSDITSLTTWRSSVLHWGFHTALKTLIGETRKLNLDSTRGRVSYF